MFGFNKSKPPTQTAARAAFNAAVRDAIAKALDHVPRTAIARDLDSHSAEIMGPIFASQERRQAR
jgi:hypothetical protein